MRVSVPRPASSAHGEAPRTSAADGQRAIGDAASGTSETSETRSADDAASTPLGPAQSGTAWSGWATYLVLVVLVVSIFTPTLWHGFVNWDDGQHVYANPVVTEPWSRPTWERLTTPSVGYPTPLPSFVHGLLWMSGRGAAWPFHACSLVIHLLIAALLLRALQRRGVAPWLALGGTLAFAIHPIVVEPVAWVTGLKDLGVGLGVVLLVSSVPRVASESTVSPATTDRADTPSRLVLVRLGELSASLLAIASKPSAGLLGFAFVAQAWSASSSASRTKSSWSMDVALTMLLAALTSAVGLFALWFARLHQPDTIRTTLDAPWTVSRPLAALGVTAEHVLAPVGLSPVTPAASTTSIHVLLGILVALGFTSAWVYFVRRRDERAYWLTLALLAWLPVSNVVPLVRFTADSYVYVPWLLLCATLTVSIHEIVTSDASRAYSPSVARLARGAAIVWLAVSSVGSALQVRVWRDDVSLWTAAVETHPNEGALVVRLGDALGRSGDVRGELALYFAHEDALQDHGVVPPALLAFLGARGEDEALARWFSIGLRAATERDESGQRVEQAETFYGYYAAFVVRSGLEPADVNGVAFARGLPLLEAAPADYGITTTAQHAALSSWRQRFSEARVSQ